MVDISNIPKHTLPLSAAGISENDSLSYNLLAWFGDTQALSFISVKQAQGDLRWTSCDATRNFADSVHCGTVSNVWDVIYPYLPLVYSYEVVFVYSVRHKESHHALIPIPLNLNMCSHISGLHNEQTLEESLFSLRSIQVSYFLRTRSTVMSDVSIRAPRQNTHLPRRLHVIRDGELANPPSLLTARVEGSRSSISPSLWLKWNIECVCAAHWVAHYNALACCWK